MTVQRRHEIKEAQWEQIKKHFPERKAGELGRPRNEDRQILNGIMWVIRTGAPWRDLPERYGVWNTVYSRFAEWQKSGLYKKILAELGMEADLQDMGMDSAAAQAHQHSAGAKKGRKTAMSTSI